MGYTKDMDCFRDVDVLACKKVEMKQSGLSICTLNFKSLSIESFFSPKHPQIVDVSRNHIQIFEDSTAENNEFCYPVFLPEGTKKYSKVIILLHGLNERTWTKYLPWANQLAKSTGSAIILFPISYHINRAPKEWSDPRIMVQYSLKRSRMDKTASFANVALSERLNSTPSRFFYSGMQSAEDLISLFHMIREGNHPYIQKQAGVNFFAYSIGAFLAQVLFLANPYSLFSDSRLFMFSGGAFFNRMNGVSKLIMDQSAFRKVYDYYTDDFECEANRDTRLGQFLSENRLAMAFRSMIDANRLRDFRNDLFSKFKDQIYAISLLKDLVIPATGVSEFFRQIGSKNIEMVEFAYPYSHEQPFPIIGRPSISHAADGGFNHVFKRAASFLG